MLYKLVLLVKYLVKVQLWKERVAYTPWKAMISFFEYQFSTVLQG